MFALRHLLFPLLAAARQYADVLPIAFALGQTITLDATSPHLNQTIVLSPDTPVLTIDYGLESAGFPFFDVLDVSAPAQIEVKYSESFVALANPNSDGPWTYSNGLSNSFRVETFNLTQPGRTESFFIQGGQRWETITLLSNETIHLASVGLRATSDHLAASDVPSKMRTSNEVYDRIWDLGSRVVQAACIDSGNAPSTWKITDEGALIRGQQTAQTANGSNFGNYTLSFATKIQRGGTGWRVASGLIPTGAVFYLTSNYPESTTYLNTNRTLLPPNTLVFNYGFSIVNQSTLLIPEPQYYPLNVTVTEDTWYNIRTTINADSYEVSLDGTLIASVKLSPEAASSVGSPALTLLGAPLTQTGGTWGFGPWSDQAAYYRDVKVTALNGSLLYSNPMTSDSVPGEYNVASLESSVCLDGAKRDRLVWAGDFYHTTRVLGASTVRWDYILGSIEYVLDRQRKTAPYNGLLPISAPLGAPEENVKLDAFLALFAGLVDYQDLFLASIAHYFWSTGDAEHLRPYWEQVKSLVNARLAYIDPHTGLMAGEGTFYFLGPVNGSAVSALSSYAFGSLIPLANALNDSSSATLLQDTAASLSNAINTHLWNSEIGFYSDSIDDRGNFSITSAAWTVLSGTANSSQAASMIAKLPELRLGVGYKTSSSAADSNSTQLSPNIGGFLLESLFKAERDLGVNSLTVAKSLLDDFWSKMVTQDEYYSGAAWEYLYPDGSPGIDLFTSLAHPWGAAPTYVLPEYLVGVTATSPGYRSFQFQPMVGALNLTHANATVITPHGPIKAEWKLSEDGEHWTVSILPPKGTTGSIVLPAGFAVEDHAAETHKRGSGNEIIAGERNEFSMRRLR